ncbi:hypothetical protein NAT65_01215 [Achromobacter xylosoxidans]|uniref:hypothetical protein n=1 Tax=Alcaligenes xylosoxydans xylosoxydans TaxID=85698 RepID=UPI0020423F75|nr:hypothetical protein [Achromobacter xylosoxidans]MCM2569689.1 hypothetical protein [Achromobacter xylosoxidans]
MDFFAIANAPVQKVYRILLEQRVQASMDALFEQQGNVISDPNLAVIPFEGGNFTPDESEVLEISPYDLPAFIFDPLQNVAGCETLPASDEVIGSISSVFAYDAATDKLIFQVIQKAQRLATSSLAILLSKNTFKRLDDPGLVLGSAAHAVYEAGCLKFKSMWWAKQIFDISDFYRNATEADVDRFAQIPALHVSDLAKLKKKTGQWARTRIAFIVDSGVLNKFTPSQLAAQAQQFNLTLDVVQGAAGHEQLVIPEDMKELRSVLKFLEEEFYIGVITGVPYETNSKRKR